MSISKEVSIRLVAIEGFAAHRDNTGVGGDLSILLLTDTPEVREAVLDAIGDELPPDKIVFEPPSEASKFQALQHLILRVDGVIQCGRDKEQMDVIYVHLVSDTPEVREAVLKVVGDRFSPNKVRFVHTTPIIAD